MQSQRSLDKSNDIDWQKTLLSPMMVQSARLSLSVWCPWAGRGDPVALVTPPEAAFQLLVLPSSGSVCSTPDAWVCVLFVTLNFGAVFATISS